MVFFPYDRTTFPDPANSNCCGTVIRDLELNTLLVIYPGKKAYPLLENVQVVPLDYVAMQPGACQ